MNYSKGICWIDDCRIPFVDESENTKRKVSGLQDKMVGGELINNFDIKHQQDRDKGRFPANLLVSDDMLNDGSIGKSNDNKWLGGKEKNWKGHTNKRIHTYNDKGTNSRYYDIDKWFENLLNGDTND